MLIPTPRRHIQRNLGLSPTNLRFTGNSGFSLAAPLPFTGGRVSIGGNYIRLFVEDTKTRQKALVSGIGNVIDAGLSVGGFKYINGSASLDSFPADGTRIYQGKKAFNKNLTLKDLSGPAFMLSGAVGSLTAGSGAIIVWPSSCEEFWPSFSKVCDCVKESVKARMLDLSLSSAMRDRILHAKAIGAVYGIGKSSSPAAVGITVSDLALSVTIQ